MKKIFFFTITAGLLIAFGLAMLGGMILSELKRKNAPVAVTKVVEPEAERLRMLATMDTVAGNTVLDVNQNTDQRISEVLAKLGEMQRQARQRNYTAKRKAKPKPVQEKPRKHAIVPPKPEAPPARPAPPARIDYDQRTGNVNDTQN